jgi:hypothetical protein
MHKVKYVKHVSRRGTIDGSLVESKPDKLYKMAVQAVIDVWSENVVGKE